MEKMNEIKEILENLCADIKFIRTAFITSSDGFIIDSFSREEDEPETMAAYVAPRIADFFYFSNIFKLGQFQTLMMEYDKGIIIITGFGENAALVVCATEKNYLGILRIKVRKAAKRIKELL